MSQITASRAGARPRLVLAVMCVGMFLVQLDVTVVNVALPSIGVGLRTGLAGQQWVVDGYAVTLASLLLVGGWIGDRYGHRPVVIAGLGLFGAASVLCGAAPGIGALVAGRVGQGLGAALLLPGTLAVITHAFPDRAEQARAVGIWAGVSALALPAGPVVGGALVSTIGWRAVFLVNVPVVAVAIPAAWRLVDGTRRRASTGRLGGAGIGSLSRRPAFVGANVVSAAMNLVGLGTVFVATLYLQSVQGHSAFVAGLMMVPTFVPLAVLAPVSGRLAARYGPRLPMTVGLVVGAAASAGLVGLTPDSGYGRVLPVLLGLGIGMGFLTAAVVGAAVRAVPPERAGLASGVNNTCRQAAGALGVGLYGVVAGSPRDTMAFVGGLHVLGLLAAGLWVLAIGLTRLTIDRPD